MIVFPTRNRFLTYIKICDYSLVVFVRLKCVLLLDRFMLAIIFWICIFIVSIAVLVKSSDYFTDAAEKLGLRLGFSPFIIVVMI